MEDDGNVTEITDVGKEHNSVEEGSSMGVATVTKSIAAHLMYSLDEMNNFLDENFGKVVDVADFFLDKGTFLVSKTHSDKETKTEWGMWWEDQIFLSHGINFSSRVAILFSKRLKAAIRLLIVHAEITGTGFLFVNVYASNVGSERVKMFYKFRNVLAQYSGNLTIVMGVDWNYTTDFTVDRNGEEPHIQSSGIRWSY